MPETKLLLLLSRFSRVRLCDPIGGSPPGSAVPGILQARTLEWAAMSFSNAWKWKVKVKSPSRVHLSATPWNTAYQAPLPMGILQPTGVGCHCFLPAWLLLIPKYSVTQEQRTCLQKVTKCLPFLILAITVLSYQVLKHWGDNHFIDSYPLLNTHYVSGTGLSIAHTTAHLYFIATLYLGAIISFYR